MKTKYNNILLGIVAIIGAIVAYKLPSLLLKPKYEPLPEVRLVNQKEESTKGFAIMIPNENGDGYVEYEGDTWPSGYYFIEAKCVDNNGNLLENIVTFKDEKVELQTASTVYCTLYFDKGMPTIKILREKDTQGYLSEDLVGGMYRYQGTTSNNITNYICFGTKSQSECTNNEDKYMYRIIGITKQGQLYLIKKTPIKEGSTTTFAWNTAYRIDSGSGVNYCPNGVCPEWNEADLFKRLNGTANGSTSGNGNGTHSNTDIFVDSTQYDYLKSGDKNGTNDGIGNDWYNLIEDHEWMYGDTMIYWEETTTYIGDIVYEVETGQATTLHYFGPYRNSPLTPYKWKNKVTAKISLMYIHDYIYSYYDGSNPTTRGNPGSYGTAKSGWILSDGSEWFSTRTGALNAQSYEMRAHAVSGSDGWTGWDNLNNALFAQPVFYLSSKAKIASGDGTKENPYILSGE